MPAAAGATHGNDMSCLLLPGNATYWRPAILSSRNAVGNGLVVVSHRRRRRAIIRLGRQRARVNDAKSAVWRFDTGADVHATSPAEQEIGSLQAKSIALQLRGISCFKDDLRSGIRRTHGIVGATKPTLAGTHRPFRRAGRAHVAKANCTAVAPAPVAGLTHTDSHFCAFAQVHTTGSPAPARRQCA